MIIPGLKMNTIADQEQVALLLREYLMLTQTEVLMYGILALQPGLLRCIETNLPVKAAMHLAQEAADLHIAIGPLTLEIAQVAPPEEVLHRILHLQAGVTVTQAGARGVQVFHQEAVGHLDLAIQDRDLQDLHPDRVVDSKSIINRMN